jgi:hypothetical protein
MNGSETERTRSKKPPGIRAEESARDPESTDRSVELQIPPLRYASVGMTKWRVAFQSPRRKCGYLLFSLVKRVR